MPNPESIRTLLSSISFPLPSIIDPLAVTAEYHSIWTLGYSSPLALAVEAHSRNSHALPNSFILRIADAKFPTIKTSNEVATLKWLFRNTSIPVPEILHWDATSENALGAEYMIMTHIRGVTAGDVYGELDENEKKMEKVLRQLATFHIELFQYRFDHLGSLRLEGEDFQPGPPMSGHYYQTQQIAKYFPSLDPPLTYESLNPSSTTGYTDFVSWISAHIEKYIYQISIVPSLAWTRPHIPRLQAFLAWLGAEERREKMNDVPHVLSHNDLHFSQFLVDPASAEITAVLDWEFASVVPFPTWRRSFLVYLGDLKGWQERRQVLYERWLKIVGGMEGGSEMLEDMEWKSREQQVVWETAEKLRGITQVCVYGSGAGREKVWMEEALCLLDELKIAKTEVS